MGGRASWRILSPAEQRDRSYAKALQSFNKWFRGQDVLKKAGIEIEKKGDIPSIQDIEGELSELKEIHRDFLASEGLIDDKEAAKNREAKEEAATEYKMATKSQREFLGLDEDKAKVDLYYSKARGEGWKND